jgi:hypothetical protein
MVQTVISKPLKKLLKKVTPPRWMIPRVGLTAGIALLFLVFAVLATAFTKYNAVTALTVERFAAGDDCSAGACDMP